MNNIMNKIHNVDARDIDSIINNKIIDVTITSPPYFDMKDYGVKNQIGFGQDYEEYLNDIELIFKKIFNITKKNGSLWIVINTFRSKGEIIPLPFDVSRRLQKVGWKFRDIIIWNKTKTVPWTKKGQSRGMIEYILFFIKNKTFKYNIDQVRDFESLKHWWVKYPERYSPKGKTPEEIWNYTIPTQGSWGNSHIRHFCPLPKDMIERMIMLTSDENDVILDPFAGSGSVLAQAAFMKRTFLGIELNVDYIKMFNKYISKSINDGLREYESNKKRTLVQNNFYEIILNLRALKYARTLRNSLIKNGVKDIKIINVVKCRNKPKLEKKIIKIHYDILIHDKIDLRKIKKIINKLISKYPLSTYGIEPEIVVIKKTPQFIKLIKNKRRYQYSNTNTHKYVKIFKPEEFNEITGIISSIKLDVDEKDYMGG